MVFKAVALALIAFAATAQAETHIIKALGQPGPHFEPSKITAAVGDTLEFHFYPQKHDAAMGTFQAPCKPGQGAFWSGYVPMAEGMSVSRCETGEYSAEF